MENTLTHLEKHLKNPGFGMEHQVAMGKSPDIFACSIFGKIKMIVFMYDPEGHSLTTWFKWAHCQCGALCPKGLGPEQEREGNTPIRAAALQSATAQVQLPCAPRRRRAAAGVQAPARISQLRNLQQAGPQQQHRIQQQHYRKRGALGL